MTPPATPPPQGPYGQPPQYQPPPAQPYPQPYPQAYAPPPPKKDNTVLIVVVVVVVIVGLLAAIAAWWFLMVLPTVTNPPTGTKPGVFLTGTETANTATITVGFAIPAYNHTYFRLNMEVNSTMSPTSTPMRPNGVAANVVVNSVTYTIKWTDVDGTGTLDSGDRFTVTVPTAFLPGTTFRFILLWASDGSQIADCSWTT